VGVKLGSIDVGVRLGAAEGVGIGVFGTLNPASIVKVCTGLQPEEFPAASYACTAHE
jgi:hypothetical protein